MRSIVYILFGALLGLIVREAWISAVLAVAIVLLLSYEQWLAIKKLPIAVKAVLVMVAAIFPFVAYQLTPKDIPEFSVEFLHVHHIDNKTEDEFCLSALFVNVFNDGYPVSIRNLKVKVEVSGEVFEPMNIGNLNVISTDYGDSFHPEDYLVNKLVEGTVEGKVPGLILLRSPIEHCDELRSSNTKWTIILVDTKRREYAFHKTEISQSLRKGWPLRFAGFESILGSEENHRLVDSNE